MSELIKLRAFAVKLAQAAAVPILAHYKLARVDFKSDGSEVTVADTQAEQVIRSMIAQQHPEHLVQGEEFDDQGPADAPYRWVIDPLDGTRWFALGVPLFGTLVALLYENKPVVGVINLPVSREMLYASTGGGCWLALDDGTPKRVQVNNAEVTSLDRAILSASGTHATDIEPHPNRPTSNLSGIIRQAGTFRFCGDCLQHSLVAQGAIHGAIDTIMAPWDIAAIVPCIQEAGGVVSNLAGETSNLVEGGSLVSASNAHLHDQILKTLQAG